MKKLLIIVLTLMSSLTIEAVAQESIIPEIKYADLDKYIALAKQNYPRRKIFETRQEVLKTAIPMANFSYLDMFSASYFYRPEKRAVIDPLNPYNVNGFQFSVNFNLGNFLQKPYMVKRAKAEYKISQLEAEEYDTQLEMEVKTRYYDYIQLVNQLKIATQSAQDSKEVSDGVRRRFEKGEVTLDVYSQSRINQSAASTARIEAEIAYLKAKDALEEIIGEKLSEVK
jgi:outer membrane protein TolC